jgi:hypothetical protein
MDRKRIAGYRPSQPPPLPTRDDVYRRHKVGVYSDEHRTALHHQEHQRYHVGTRYVLGWAGAILAVVAAGTTLAAKSSDTTPNHFIFPPTGEINIADPNVPVPNDKMSEVTLKAGQVATLQVCGAFKDGDGRITLNTIATEDNQGHLLKAQVSPLGNEKVTIGLGHEPVGLSLAGGWLNAKGEVRQNPLECSTVLAEAETYKASDGTTRIHLVPEKVIAGAMVQGSLQREK